MAKLRQSQRRAIRRRLSLSCLLGATITVAFADPALGDPPPWTDGARAPAQSQIAYRFPPGLKDGRCRPGMFDAAAVRGLVAALRNDSLRDGPRRNAGRAAWLDGTAIGTLLAAVGGPRPARGISRQNEICFTQVFEHVPDQVTVAWSDGTLTVQYSVVPMRTLKTRDGGFCREYAAKATVNGHAADVSGTACRESDGNWRLID